MADRVSRPATPPPASREYEQHGAVVRLPSLRVPTLPSARELDADDLARSGRAAERRFALALEQVRGAMVTVRPLRLRAGGAAC